MLPGTYTPTDPREIEAFALHRAQQDVVLFSKAVHEAELNYKRQGLQYHLIPINLRKGFQDERAKSYLKAEFTVNPNNMPRSITLISGLRSSRDEIKQSIRQGQGIAAEECLQNAWNDIHEIRLVISKAHGYLIGLQSQLAEISLNAPVGEYDKQEAENAANIWILHHPDVQKSIALGFYTPHRAISAAWQEQVNGPEMQQGMFADLLQTLNRGVQNAGFVAPPPSIEDEDDWSGLETGSNY